MADLELSRARQQRRTTLLGEYLRARRALVDPAQVGVGGTGHRRVPGLRREELAFLAGVSVSYLIRLEQGRDQNPSRQVLDALALALQLDDDATVHLERLAAPEPRTRKRPPRPERVRPALQTLLDCAIASPALILGRRLDVLAANDMATALHPSFREVSTWPERCSSTKQHGRTTSIPTACS